MEDIYKAEKLGRNWCITKNGELFRTIGAYYGSEQRAIEQALELNIAYTLGYKEGLQYSLKK